MRWRSTRCGCPIIPKPTEISGILRCVDYTYRIARTINGSVGSECGYRFGIHGYLPVHGGIAAAISDVNGYGKHTGLIKSMRHGTLIVVGGNRSGTIVKIPGKASGTGCVIAK